MVAVLARRMPFAQNAQTLAWSLKAGCVARFLSRAGRKLPGGA